MNIEPFDLSRSLGRLEGKMDSLLVNTAALTARQDKADLRLVALETASSGLSDLPNRVGALEKWQGKLMTIGLAASSVGGALLLFKDEILRLAGLN